ncbi:MAG: hypothetical protein PVJ53_17625 [Desulfobacterales bacterium]|jgi:hypothetical protein
MPEPKEMPDFFEAHTVDPVRSATGGPKTPPLNPKKKAGFYLSLGLIERFDRKFHELKLAGAAVGNKSALLEAALAFALDDLDRGEESEVLARI